MDLGDVVALAQEDDDDVILINENADPPLVRICAMSKYRYELEKVKKDQSKKQRESMQTLKELKMTPRTDVHDFEVKVKQAQNFLSKGDKVKILIQFKGREVAGMKSLATEMVDKLIAEVSSIANVDHTPRMAGNSMIVMLTPKKE